MPVSQRKFTAADLIPGQTYRVVAGFKDYDGIIHSAGETWKFLEKNFLPYEDGLSLFLEKEGQRVQLRLQWREESQGRIIDQFSGFVEEI
jgi:hypothetical protein